MAKVKLELSRKNTTEKTDLAKKVVTKMTGNTNYTTPNPALATITSAVNAVSLAYAELEAARKTVQAKSSALSQQETILEGLLTQEAAYVENISNGDETKILSAGMDVQKEKSTSSIPEKIIYVNATLGENAGEIDLSWDKVNNAKSYVIETAVNVTPLVWRHTQVCTKSKAEVTGLETGVSYQLRVSAIGSAGHGPWSDPVIKVAP